jgi:light-regulated signal transduction histidine kinase (bacteriophytochrome)
MKDLPDVKYVKNTLDQIISNLISNAIKFSPPSTQVKIYNELLSDRLKIVVQDQGKNKGSTFELTLKITSPQNYYIQVPVSSTSTFPMVNKIAF